MNIFIRLLSVLLVIVATLSPSVRAGTVEISSAKVAVDGQGSAERRAALRASLRQVLVKMTGSVDVVENAQVKQLLRQADSVLLSYRYETEQGRLYYIAQFDEQKLLELLRAEQLPIWGSRRPDTLLWIAVEDDARERVILSDSARDGISSEIRYLTEQRGIPVIFPIMDLTDASAINLSDVWGQFTSVIVQASKRYAVNHIFTARVYATTNGVVPTIAIDDADINQEVSKVESSPTTNYVTLPPEPERQTIVLEGIGEERIIRDDKLGREVKDFESVAVEKRPAFTQQEFENSTESVTPTEKYTLEWQSILNGEIVSGKLMGADKSELIRTAMTQYADALAVRYAINANPNNSATSEVTLSIANVVSLDKYVEISTFLNSISLVENAELSMLQNSVGTFTIRYVGDTDDLFRLLTLDSPLVAVSDAFGRPLPGNHYYWKK